MSTGNSFPFSAVTNGVDFVPLAYGESYPLQFDAEIPGGGGQSPISDPHSYILFREHVKNEKAPDVLHWLENGGIGADINRAYFRVYFNSGPKFTRNSKIWFN